MLGWKTVEKALNGSPAEREEVRAFAQAILDAVGTEEGGEGNTLAVASAAWTFYGDGAQVAPYFFYDAKSLKKHAETWMRRLREWDWEREEARLLDEKPD